MKLITLIRGLTHYLNLESELDDLEKVHETIVKDTIFKGTNLWILVFAIVVASVGLNTNSTAVIIGAMLISPLMGPINGIGYSLATYNLELFRQSLKNLSFAILASLVASTGYFALSPLSTAHSELLARTTPTIYDVLIALFGGMAGIVAATSKQKGNVIPGVAIATALMPPLCTAGYGLATGQFNFFFGAFYLFTINSVFIALASVIISQILNFPIRTVVGTAQKKRINRWISFVIIIVLVPSVYFGYVLVQKEKFIEAANNYISNVSAIDGNYLLKSQHDDKTRAITLVYGGVSLTPQQKEMILDRAVNFGLDKNKISISQGLALEFLNEGTAEAARLREEISGLAATIREKDALVDSITRMNTFGKTILDELSAIYPQVTGCSFSGSLKYSNEIESPEKTALVVLETGNGKISGTERKKIEAWLKARLSTDNVRLFFE
ncbi:MAG: DUF389 domain-containing protein [Bacteroidales bacterium]|jgi:uncharacterized hydrophobic protein (TIGR00271 family)|nr:DUF389 domain-containing protein [Bacteroidales bacterium]